MYFYYTLRFSAFRRSGFWPRADSGAHAASVLSSGVTEPPISADGEKEEEGKRPPVASPAAESRGVIGALCRKFRVRVGETMRATVTVNGWVDGSGRRVGFQRTALA